MVLRERTVSIRSVLKGWSGSGNKRGCSSVKAWVTVRALSSGQGRRCATSSRQCGEDAPSPERIAYIPNGPFHAAFLISRAYLARTWHEVIISRQFQQP